MGEEMRQMTLLEFVTFTLLGLVTGTLALVAVYSATHHDWLLALVSAVAAVIFGSTLFRKDGELL
jgi:uncharacterized membrane protein YdjX (TVP38/TMEM64 family)